MAYGRKYYKEFDGYNAVTKTVYSVLVDIYQDGYVGAATEIENITASPLQLSLDSSGDPLYTPIKKTSASFNIIDTGQFDYSEFYTSNAKKYKMVITSPVFNWAGYLVPQAVSFDLATNGEFSLTASDGLHLLSTIDYVADPNAMLTLSDFITDIETKIGLSTFNRTSTINTEYGNIWNSLVYQGMFTDKTYEKALEMVLKAIGMQVRYWKILPIISVESALQTTTIKCTNDFPELNFLAPIKNAKVTQKITTLPNALSGALVDDAKDLMVRKGGYYTLKNWLPASDNGVICSIGQMYTGRFQDNKYTDINVFTNPTNYTYTGSPKPPLSAGSYYKLRKVKSTALSLTFSANFGRIGTYQKFDDGYTTTICPVKWSSIRWGLYDEINDRSFNILTGYWDIVGVPTRTNSNELKVTNPADSYTDILVEVAYLSSFTESLRFYLFQGQVEYNDFSGDYYDRKLPVLSIKSIKLDGEDVVRENELYTSVTGNVAVGENIDVLDYEVEFSDAPTPPLNTSLYYGSAFFDNQLNQLLTVIIGANSVSFMQYIFNSILYTQNEIRKKVYTANVNMLTNVSPFWLKTTLKDDTVMVNSCTFDFKTSQLNAELTEIMPYVYREWSIVSDSEIGSSDWGGSGGTSGSVGGGGGSVDLSNCVVKTGATSQDIEGDISVDNMISRGAVVAGALNGTLPDDLPVATSLLYGTIKFDPTTLALNGSNQLTVIGGGWSNVVWGTPTSQYTPLTINSVTRNLSLDGHTHSYLPLSGGELTRCLSINTPNSGGSSYIAFKRNNVDIGYIGDGASGPNTEIAVYNYISGKSLLLHNDGILRYGGNIVWHAGNDGAGSGLDADLLRGVAPSNLAVLSATKLANTRTIWGQPFNGENDITGNLKIGYANVFGISYSPSDANLYNYFYGGSVFNLKVGEWTSGNVNVFNIETHNGGTAKRAFSVMNNGFIGINTNNPVYDLDVNGATRSNYVLFKNYNDNGSAGYVGRGATNNNSLQLLSYSGNSVYIGANENDVAGITINTSNYVGIGTTSPSYKLDVNGSFRTVGAAYLNSTLEVAGTSTLTGLLTANGGIGSTTGAFSSYLTANRFYTGYDSGLANAISCSNWFRSNGATGWLNATYSAGILSDTANIVRTYSINKFKVYNTAIDSILTLGGVTAANVISSGAVVAGALNGTLPDDLPIATGSLFGVIKTGVSLFNNAGLLNINGRHYTTTSTYTDAAVREITAELVLGTGNMTSGTLDQIQLDFAPLTTTRGLTGNIITTATGAGMSLKISFRKDTGTGRWYLMIYNDSGATVVRDGILISIRGQQTI